MTQNKKSRDVRLTISTLKAGWHDKDKVMLHAAFQLLTDFVEQEFPGKYIDWNHDAVHRRAWKEICDLYQWWTKTRPSRRTPLDDKRIIKPPVRFQKVAGTKFSRLMSPDKNRYEAYYRALRRHTRLEQKWRREDQRNFHRLVNVREFLWT
jgi:hypothetical protein